MKEKPRSGAKPAVPVQESPVADDPSTTPGPFDVRTVQQLVALMTQHDLSEIDLQEGDQRLRLRRGFNKTAPLALPASIPAPVPAPAPAAPAPAAPAVAAPPAGAKLLEIKSPTVGTFYARPKPEDPAFVSVGSKVSATTVVCLIEAMKIFNEINADCAGVIREILVENQQAVEYGQVLFRVDPAG
jgi:acetyl-CoA carboxylase biotin carboxyl carrier protein